MTLYTFTFLDVSVVFPPVFSGELTESVSYPFLIVIKRPVTFPILNFLEYITDLFSVNRIYLAHGRLP